MNNIYKTLHFTGFILTSIWKVIKFIIIELPIHILAVLICYNLNDSDARIRGKMKLIYDAPILSWFISMFIISFNTLLIYTAITSVKR